MKVINQLIIKTVLAISVLVFCVNVQAAPVVKALHDGWQFRMDPDGAKGKEYKGAFTWLPATIPGVVQTDLMSHGLLDDPYIGLNEADAQWVGLSDWQYRTEFTLGDDITDKRQIEMIFEGLDTFAEVKVNGVSVLVADNQFRTWRVDVKDALKKGKNLVEINFESPIEKMRPFMDELEYVLPGSYDSMFGDEPLKRNSSAYVRKAGYQYGWDWGPRLVAIGIWKPVKIEAYDDARVEDFYVAQKHLDDDVAAIEGQFEVWSDKIQKADLAITVTSPDGDVQQKHVKVDLFPGMNNVSVPAQILKPKRWYPVGYGKPEMYDVEGKVKVGGDVVATLKKSLGLRTTEIRRTHDQWGRSFEIIVNGTPIFMKGANAIPYDLFPSRVTREQQEDILQSAADANMNMIRYWGGGVYQADYTYEVADRLGLMVWQDFMFGGAITPYDEAFRESTRLEAIDQVKRLRQHPSIVIWGGNNEVQTDWQNWGAAKRFNETLPLKEYDRLLTGMIRLFDQVLRAAVNDYSPGVPYWAGSPTSDYDSDADMDTDGDRHYWTVWGGKAPVEEFLNVTPRFMSEYGLQAFPVMETIETFAKEKDMEPETAVMRSHQKYDKGNGNKRLMLYINNNYGEPVAFEDFVYLSQLMQAEGIELAALHHRVSRPQTMGSLYWQLNDVWPGASWSSIDYYGRWKALNFHAKRFYAHVAASILRNKGETQAHIISDALEAKAMRWTIRVLNFDGKTLHTLSGKTSAKPLASTLVASLSDDDLLKGHDPKTTQAIFEISDSSNTLVSRSVVYFDAAKNLTWSDPKLTYKLQKTTTGYDVKISAEVAAKGVWIEAPGLDVTFDDNAFDMSGGETRTVNITTTASKAELDNALTLRSYFGSVKDHQK